jgi:hypothetical protein
MSKHSNFQISKIFIAMVTALVIFLLAVVFVNYPSNPSYEPQENQEAALSNVTESPINPSVLLAVDSNVVVPSIQRIGINLPQEDSQYQTDPDGAWPEKLKNMLQAVNPSYLRTRQTNPLSTVDHAALSAVLNLCTQVGANPWIALSSGIEDAELDALGDYLRNNADISLFSNVIIEFGNENSDEKEYNNSFSRLSDAAGPYVNLTNAMHGNLADQWVKETLSGTDLATALLHKMRENIQPLIVFNLANESSAPAKDLAGNMDLEIGSTQLAAIMLNQIAGGSLHKIDLLNGQDDSTPAAPSGLTMAAFRSGNEWAAAFASENDSPQTLTVEFPEDGLDLPASILILPNTSSSENFNSLNQPLKFDQRKVIFEMPAHSFVVLTH